jgi:intein-encoded DNA endonuclease-like protein
VQYIYDRPGWRAKSTEDLSKELGGAQRVIYVELTEFRTKEPGNQYLYDGVCAGTISVAEADSKLADYYSFEKSILVKFPDETGRRPEEIPETAVRTELIRRFVDRATWPFHTHEEPYYPKY